ncbi:MAG: prolyl oligopeptidase family serine peptidase [Clostridiales bacterium]|nr:prolyl oligopeptidase family serine peptidase [Clostridiales bacterium]
MSEQKFMEWKLPCNLFKINHTEYVYQVTSIEDRQYRSVIYRNHIGDGGGKEKLATGTLAAVSEQYEMIAYWEENRLVVMDLSTKEPYILGSFVRPGQVNFCSSAKKLVFTAAEEFAMEPEGVPQWETVQWIDRTKFKSDATGIYDGRYMQVFAADLEKGGIRRITTKKLDYANPAFLDENTIICTAVPKDMDVSDDAYFQMINLETGEARWAPGAGGPIHELDVSPDGSYAAVLTHDNAYWEATNYQLYKFYPKSGKLECLSSALDRSLGNYVVNDTGLKTDAAVFHFSEDGKKIYANVTDGFVTDLYEFSEEGVRRITDGSRVIMEYAMMGQDILMISSQVNTPASILRYHHGSYQILGRQDNKLEDVEAEEFAYPGHNGEAFQGYIFYPKEKPLKGIVLDIHGGPHYCHGLAYSLDVHILAEAGYAAVYANPAGSQGKGEEIARASYHDWGGKDYGDLLSCVEQVRKIPLFSALPWAVKGGSYGGYMVNWIIGHTDFFTCAISERSTCNRYSQAGTSDCAFRYGKFEFEDFPWEHCDSYMERSPITYVKNVNTPVLLIHGDHDMNCPISQSEEWYSALRLENKEVYFARFKGQNHGFAVKGDPACREERYRLLVWWLDRYMKKE